jgi:hypothetical protein
VGLYPKLMLHTGQEFVPRPHARCGPKPLPIDALAVLAEPGFQGRRPIQDAPSLRLAPFRTVQHTQGG